MLGYLIQVLVGAFSFAAGVLFLKLLLEDTGDDTGDIALWPIALILSLSGAIIVFTAALP